MNRFLYKDGMGKELIESLAQFFDVECRNESGEEILEINNQWGEGSFKSIAFNYGVNLLRFDITFRKDFYMVFDFNGHAPIDFSFLTVGELGVKLDDKGFEVLTTYQNIIVHYMPHTENEFLFKAEQRVEINIIRILPDEYAEKKNNNLEYLKADLKDVFKNKEPNTIYRHFGNFNLKIADQIRRLNKIPHDGIVRSLMIEGHMNIILGLQLLEHENYSKNIWLPETISQKDIEKIHDATDYIQNTISESVTVKDIAQKVQLAPAKLQLGFKLLFSQSVSEYIKELKLLKARDLLQNNPDITVSEVVYSIGYKNRSYFSRIFFERYGVLPTEYRKKKHS